MIRVGVGGWTFEPWRGLFFPAKHPRARELEYASRQLRTIEVNGTFYRTQTPATFEKWAAETPDGFVFTVKAPRYCVQKKALVEAGASIQRFVESGIDRLGDKLGPILWQFAPTKRYDPEDFAGWAALLPHEAGGIALRHAWEVRHPSFACDQFTDLARAHNAAIVLADHDIYPMIDEATADFAYARLQRGADEIETGYDPAALDYWADRARAWSVRGDVFAFLIHGGKMRAPAGAMALQQRVDG